MKTITLNRILIGLVFVFFSVSTSAYSETQGRGKRGDEPQCQKECLQEHSEKMAILGKVLSKTGDRLAYQDQVEEEEHRYARCLTNCRAIIPIK
jgi:hypothetical protein